MHVWMPHCSLSTHISEEAPASLIPQTPDVHGDSTRDWSFLHGTSYF
jgi:hypothetical protein